VSDSLATPSAREQITQPICCPICGVRLDEMLLTRPDDEYFCPFCCTQQKPGSASASQQR
jgi:hypothetical protein